MNVYVHRLDRLGRMKGLGRGVLSVIVLSTAMLAIVVLTLKLPGLFGGYA